MGERENILETAEPSVSKSTDRVELERLVCWSNRWGDIDQHHFRTDREKRAYEIAMHDVRMRAEKAAPDWLQTWVREEWGFHREGFHTADCPQSAPPSPASDSDGGGV